MRIFLSERKVQLSVTEFSEFKIGPSDRITWGMGRRRSEIGQKWHRELQKTAQEEFPETSFEIPIKADWKYRDWTLSLHGRIDQIVTRKRFSILREVKTIESDLPQNDKILLDNYPSYFLQLSIYFLLAQKDPRWESEKLSAELLFLDISSGFVQRVAFNKKSHSIVNQQLENIHWFLNQRWNSHLRLAKLNYRKPFTKLRQGQKETCDRLGDLWEKPELLLFEAPTGFGKTGLVLERSLDSLRRRTHERIVFVTGKSTGQLQIVRQLEKMLSEREDLYYLQIRNRIEHRISSPRHTCGDGLNCRVNITERWAAANICPISLFQNGTISLEQTKSLGRKTGICPYEITRSLLPFTDFVVADYNYLFGPQNQSLLFQIPGFDPASTLLVVDEAHNLPTRVAESLSHSLSRQEVERAKNELKFSNASSNLLRSYSELIYFLNSIKEPGELNTDFQYELVVLIENIIESLQYSSPPVDLLSKNTRDELWHYFEILEFLKDDSLSRLIWSTGLGFIYLSCLGAPLQIANTLERFSKVVMMSATLSPKDHFYGLCQINPEDSTYLKAEAPWRENAYDVATDLRVNTSYQSRDLYYFTTAATASAMCRESTTPVVLFFSAYQYANSLSKLINLKFPHLRIALQPRKGELVDREQFLKKNLSHSDLLLLVIGSSYSESIDLLGGRVSHAMIIGPALPEVNIVQKFRMQSLSRIPRNEAFRQVYQIPALTRINQALGRLVRAPGQKVKVLLHCQRFNQDSYRSLLDPIYQSLLTISSDESLNDWIQS